MMKKKRKRFSALQKRRIRAKTSRRSRVVKKQVARVKKQKKSSRGLPTRRTRRKSVAKKQSHLRTKVSTLFQKIVRTSRKITSAVKKPVEKTPEQKKKPVVIDDDNRALDLGLTPMRIYLNQIEHIPLLTADDEIQLSRKIQHRLPGWVAARERMIQSNLRLVINIAKRYANMGLTFSDLVEEGNIGLMRAVDKFHYERGYRFSTYASWWIKQGMMRALSNQAKMIRIPVHMYESITKWRKCREVYIQRFGRIPTQKELAKQMDVSEDKIREVETVLSNPGSLNIPLSLDSQNEMIDLIEDTSAEKPYEQSQATIQLERIEKLMSSVNEREKRILVLRFGLMGEEPRTLEETAREYGITRERVRQIEEAALKKIRGFAHKDEDKLEHYI